MNLGTLYIVATPIGNLQDITLRALHMLKEVALVAAEDTRHTRKLLSKYNIHTALTSYHDHNKEDKAPIIIGQLLEGKSVALVSDAGTPCISDPGYFLVNLAIDQKIRVVSIPGAVAAIAALSISGMPSDRFVFEGFLPSKQGVLIKLLQELAKERRTIIFYESPYRIIKTITAMLEVFGNRQAVVTRELTKFHEEIIRGSLMEILQHFQKGNVKGEFTIVVHGYTTKPPASDIDTTEYLRNLMLHRGLSKKEAVTTAAEELGLPKKEVYKRSLTV